MRNIRGYSCQEGHGVGDLLDDAVLVLHEVSEAGGGVEDGRHGDRRTHETNE